MQTKAKHAKAAEKDAPPETIEIRWPDVRFSKIASRDQTRWIINHVEVKDGRLAVTDGRRLIIIRDPSIPEGFQCVVPIDLVRAIEESGARFVSLTNGSAAIKSGEATISMDAVDGRYPNVESVIPALEKHDTQVSFNARLLYEIAQAIGGSKDKTQVTLSFARDDLSVGMGIHVHNAPREHQAVLMPLHHHAGPELAKKS